MAVDKIPHRDERALVKQIAGHSGRKYSQAQVEDQLRIMAVIVDGKHQSGAVATSVGEEPEDSGAQWFYAGTTSDGKPIRTQVTVHADPELQAYILEKYNSVGKDQVPSVFGYDRSKIHDWGFTLTGPLTDVSKADVEFLRTTTADSMAMVSKNAGRFGAAAAIPSPYAPGLAAAAFGATVVGWVADAIGQAARPDPGAYVTGGFVGIAVSGASNKFPFAGPFINEAGSALKQTDATSDAASKINNVVGVENEDN